MAGFHQIFMIFLMEFIKIGPVYIRGWAGGARGCGGWWQKLRVAIYDVYMHPQRANIPLQGLDRRALTVGDISGPNSQLGAFLSTISPVVDLHGRQKAFRESRPVHISQ